jgi:hypothetical protein
MPINGFLYPGAKVVKGYNVDNSVIFNSGDSAELTKTFSSAGNQKTWTFSFWVKRSGISGSTTYSILEAGHGTTPWFIFTFNNDILQVAATAGSSAGWSTSAVFRDASAWYHIVLVVDTTSSTSSISNGSSDRFRIFVNNVQQTLSGGTVPSLNADLQWNGTAGQHMFGASYGQFFDGYVCEVAFIDGSALTPSSFGEYDEDSPTIWKPKDFKNDVTFGTNGFYLEFSDSSALGDDTSGNNNDWTVANLTATDQSTDTCTNNFATYNALLSQVAGVDGRHSSWNGQLAEGNLSSGTAVDIYNNQFSTFGLTSGKWYAEFKMSTTDNNFSHGIVNDVFFSNLGSYIGQSTASGVRNIGYYSQNGQVLKNNSAEYTGSSYGSSSADLISIALDLDNNFVYFAKNGTYQNSGDPTSGSSGTGGVAVDADTTWFLGSTTHSLSSSGLKISYANFGSPPTGFTISSGNADANGHGNFEYSVPSGYFALCSKNLAEYG